MFPDHAATRLLAVLGLGCAVGAELLDSPSKENFVRRSDARATVLGNYVYVDGGEVAQLEDGKISSYRASNQVNSTLSIDISKSWTTSDVAIRTITKPGIGKANVALWTDTEAGVFYSWGGRFPFGLNMTKSVTWKFTPDGSGGGEWSTQEPTNPALFNGLHTGEFGAFADTGETGFLIGGLASGWTELYRAYTQTLPGMVAFDMKTKVWQNGTDNFSPFHTLVGATAQYVPTFGPNGLVLVMGGHRLPVEGDPNVPIAPFYDMKNLTLFDPVTKETYWQTASGDIPPTPRMHFCSVGYQNSDGGYEIFMFGGTNRRDEFNYEDAYVLSLPGFVWTQVPNTPAGRRRGAGCVAVGKRQVLIIGGTNSKWDDPDPAPNGLLLFDMVSLKWTDSYDANANAYELADEIKEWYNNGSLEKVDWSSDKVRTLFAAEVSNSPTPTPSADPDTPSSSSSSSSSTPVGAIVGGVVGGLAALALIGVIAWLIIRRRRQNNNTDDYTTPPTITSTEMGNSPQTSELMQKGYHYTPTGTPTPELDTRQYAYSELHANPPTQPEAPVEMDGTSMGRR